MSKVAAAKLRRDLPKYCSRKGACVRVWLFIKFSKSCMKKRKPVLAKLGSGVLEMTAK